MSQRPDSKKGFGLSKCLGKTSRGICAFEYMLDVCSGFPLCEESCVLYLVLPGVQCMAYLSCCLQKRELYCNE